MMKYQFTFPKCFATGLDRGVPGAALLDPVELRNRLDNSASCCLVYPLPWQICNQPDCEEHVQNWISAMVELLSLQDSYAGLLQFMPLDVYFQICKVENSDSFQLNRFRNLGALLFANRFPDAFDFLTAIEANAELNGRDPFVRFDYPSLPINCIDDLTQLVNQAEEQQSSGDLSALGEMNSRLMEQIRLMQESLERNYLENQALRYEAEKSAKTMQRAYRLIMDRSAANSSREQ